MKIYNYNYLNLILFAILYVVIFGFANSLPVFAEDIEPLQSQHKAIFDELSLLEANNIIQDYPVDINFERKAVRPNNLNNMNNTTHHYINFYETEPNNSIHQANLINSNYYGQAYYNIFGTITDYYYDLDYFRFDVTKSGTFDIIGYWAGNYYGYGWEDDLGLGLCDANGNLIAAALLKGSGYDAYRHLVAHVNPGTYYILVLQMSDFQDLYVGEWYALDMQFYADPSTVSTPTAPSGPGEGFTNINYNYSTGGSVCSNGHNVQYRFDWGNGTYSSWSSSTAAAKTWTSPGIYQVKAQARCAYDNSIISSWSSAKIVNITADSPPGSLQIFIEPVGARDDGAQWRLISSTPGSSSANTVSTAPLLDLANVSYDAMEYDVLRIKFKPAMTKVLDRMKVTSSEKGIAITGINDIDSVNAKYGAHKFTSLIEPLYKLSEVSKQYQDRHRDFGLHLWYEIHIEAKQDIKEAINSYNKLESIEIAEPLYKKVHTTNITILEERRIESYTEREHLQGSWTPSDPLFSNQWNYHNAGQHNGTPGADIDLINAWDIEKGNPEVLVAVVDNGIQYDHPDLAANIWPGIGPDGTGTLPGNHGTHVAGTIAAVTNNNTGVAGIAGGSGSGNGIRIMSIDIFGVNHGLSHLAIYAYQADNGVAISQNSWKFKDEGVFPQNTKDGIDYFNTHGGGSVLEGGLTIFAAGNDNNSGNWYPPRYEGVMAVAATNNQDIKASYSNYGSWIEISAPGGETSSLIERGVLSTITGNNYDYYQGTSMACPHVSGVAALLVSLAPGQFTATEIRSMIKETADNHYAVNSDYIGQLGSGRLNAYQALLMAQSEMNEPNEWKNSGETISDLPPGTYTITFKDIAGWTKPADINVNVVSSQTTTATGTYITLTQPSETPALISPVHGEIIQGSSVLLEWAPAAGATHYAVWIYNLTTDEQVIFSAPIEDTSYVHHGLTGKGDIYAWSVVASNIEDGTWGDFAIPLVFIDGSDKDLLPPTLISPEHYENVPGTQVELQWEAPVGGTHYAVWVYNLTKDEQVIFTAPIEETFYILDDLYDNGDVYAWSVVASNINDLSWSDFAFPRLFFNE